MQISIVGCGVTGLTCGVAVLEDPELAGSRVTIYADKLPPETTSDASAAIWFPYGVYGDDRLLGWAERTLRVFHELSEIPEAGVRPIDGTQLFRSEQPEPEWKGIVEAFWPAREEEVRRELGYVQGYGFRTRLIEMGRYLPYLMGRFIDGGGVITRVEQPLASLDELNATSDVVINCAGVYARRLVGDETVYPSRGQVARITKISRTDFVMDLEDEEELLYVVPRTEDCIVGGTAQKDNWKESESKPTTLEILERCARLVPEIRDAEVIDVRVGLRPERRPVRLERDSAHGRLIHDYGHGGSGVTLSWGCAYEVVSLIVRSL